jgi:Ca2+-binding RTX toxin-like protein
MNPNAQHSAMTASLIHRSSLRRLAAVTLFGALVATSGVAASDVDAGFTNYLAMSGNQITFVGGPEDNRVIVEDGGDGTRIVTDMKHDFTTNPSDPSCTKLGWGRARCFGSVATFVISTDAGNDFVQGGPDQDIVDGGAGNDELRGGDARDDLRGGSGSDKLYGEGGDDKLSGGAADTSAWNESNDGSDYLSGGPGQDWVTYLMKGSGTRLSLDGLANDGTAGEYDRLESDVEDLTGSQYDDVITGNAYQNALFGTWGDDRIYGQAGDDLLYGENGIDSVWGESGNDRLFLRHSDRDLYINCGSGINVLERDPVDPLGLDC